MKLVVYLGSKGPTTSCQSSTYQCTFVLFAILHYTFDNIISMSLLQISTHMKEREIPLGNDSVFKPNKQSKKAGME